MQYEKVKVAAQKKIPLSVFNDIKLEISQTGEDFINEVFTVRMQAFIYESTIAEKEVIYTFDKPSFLDWLLGRKRTAKFHIKMSEVLTSPPSEKNITTYKINPEKRIEKAWK